MEEDFDVEISGLLEVEFYFVDFMWDVLELIGKEIFINNFR